jgi:NitT/TauT family transport system substrate-binding protein
VKIISGTASGGAYLVVKPNINSAADLKGKKVATPQLGNTQDVALRTWLNDNGLHMTKDSGDVTVVPQENSVTLTSFQQGAIQGAWVPEPWATRLVNEGGGKVLIDEKTLWPKGEYTTTVLVVTKKFLDAHPDVVENLVTGLVDTVALTKSNPAQAEQLTNQGIEKLTGKKLKDDVIKASFDHIVFTEDPVASSLQTSADHAKALGFLSSSDLQGIFDLSILNKVLKAQGKPEVAGT